jgi:hypothetical protein
MGKMKELYLEQQQAASGSGDEDFLYEQYIAQEQMNEQYWQWRSTEDTKKVIFSDDIHRDKPHSIFPDEVQYDDEYYKSTYIPTKEEEDENYIRTIINETNKQNGHT